MRLEHPRLLVSNFAECFLFYRDVLSFKVTWGSEDDSYASFTHADGADVRLALFKRQAMAEVLGTAELPQDAVCQDRFALIIRVEDVDALWAELSEEGIEMVTGPQDFPDWGIKSAYIRDPDGNLIELHSELDPSQWSEGLREASEKQQDK
jgi:catechol 2,3-dioxygenase-like lactoylglutathione lyase family enzyme